jgi:hypothetical protein
MTETAAKEHGFDFSKFLADKWGGPDALLAFLHAYGHDEFPRPTINQWFRRGSVPAETFALLLGLLKLDTGRDAPVEEYLR